MHLFLCTYFDLVVFLKDFISLVDGQPRWESAVQDNLTNINPAAQFGVDVCGVVDGMETLKSMVPSSEVVLWPYGDICTLCKTFNFSQYVVKC